MIEICRLSSAFELNASIVNERPNTIKAFAQWIRLSFSFCMYLFLSYAFGSMYIHTYFCCTLNTTRGTYCSL